MRSDNKILTAFLLNLVFSAVEFVGGVFTGSTAIISDAVHDLGDAASIGVSYALERKSKGKPDERYTYGYGRYSVVGGMLTTLILILGSCAAIGNAVYRIIHPTEINYNGMILLAVFGVAVNFCAAYFTRDGGSLNQRAVNLHMLEDVLGWAAVLAGALIMRFTDIAMIDPILSICTAVFVLVGAVRNMKETMDIFLERAPRGIDADELTAHLLEIDGVLGIHHLHLWGLDGENNLATMHIVVSGDHGEIKQAVRRELSEHGIGHATLELESEGEDCPIHECHTDASPAHHHYHHHHHHH